MKKIIISALILATAAISGIVQAMPVYTDDLPASYIQKYSNVQKKDLSQQFTALVNDNNVVKVYTEKEIVLQTKTEKIDKTYQVLTTPQINDKFDFVVAEDVMKDGKLFIKKGTKATGFVTEAQFYVLEISSPSVISLSMFTTTDVNNNTVKLYGVVSSEQRSAFKKYFHDCTSLYILCPEYIKAKKNFTLYYK